MTTPENVVGYALFKYLIFGADIPLGHTLVSTDFRRCMDMGMLSLGTQVGLRASSIITRCMILPSPISKVQQNIGNVENQETNNFDFNHDVDCH